MITLDKEKDIVKSSVKNEDFTIELQAKLNVLQLLQSQSIIQFFLNDQTQSLNLLNTMRTADYIDDPKSVLKRSILTVDYLYRHFRDTGLVKFDSTDTYPVEVCFDHEPTVETHTKFVEDVRAIFRTYTFIEQIDV